MKCPCCKHALTKEDTKNIWVAVDVTTATDEFTGKEYVAYESTPLCICPECGVTFKEIE